MSTRCYPLFIKGNPQLRIFLPNFWMKLVKNIKPAPSNVVSFIVSTEMTSLDIKNYLENIYNVPVKEVRTRVVQGEFKKDLANRYIIKDNDFKIAHITLPDDQKFEFPNLFPEDKKQEEEKELKIQQGAVDASKERKARNWDKPGIPSWFGV